MKKLSRTDFFLIVSAMVGFAVAQPLFSILQATPEFLVIRRAQTSEILLLVIALAGCIPLVFALVREVFGLIDRVTRFHTTRLFDFAALFFLFAVFFQLSTKNILFSCVLAVVATIVVGKSEPVRKILRFLSIATPLFAAIFLWTTLSPSFLSADLGKKQSEALGQIDKSKLKPTFVIVFDEFPLFSLLNPSEEINQQRFPGFYQLSKNATWFRNGSSVTSWTERAVPAILSGTLPSTEHVQTPSTRDYPQNIFTLFSNTHRVFGYEQVTSLCPQSICPQLRKPAPFKERFQTLMEDIVIIFAHRVASEEQRNRLPSIDGKWGEFLPKPKPAQTKKRSNKGLELNDDYADDVILFDRFLNDLEKDIASLSATGINPLSVIHITFPHVPYRYLPDGSKYALDRDIGNDREYTALWPKDGPGLSATGLQRFLMQAAVADTLMQKFLNVLEKAQLLDKSVIAVTADHGSSFIPGEYSRRPSQRNYSDVLSVPFFISMPGHSREGEINDKNVSSVDILPTLLELNGLQGIAADSGRLGGQSLVSPDIKEPATKMFFPLTGELKKTQQMYPALMDRSESIQYVSKLFGDGGFDERFYQPDFTGKQLIGKSVDQIQSMINQDLIVGIHNSEKYKKLRLSPGFIPALLSGVVRYKNKQPMDTSKKTVALIMDGKVVAVGQTDNRPKGQYANFLIMVPPYLLKAGDNRLSGVVIGWP